MLTKDLSCRAWVMVSAIAYALSAASATGDTLVSVSYN